MRSAIGRLFYAVGKATALPSILKGVTRSRVGLIYGDEILLSKALISEQSWNVLGGGKKASETIEECAVREVKEESGIDIEINDLVNCGKLQEEMRGKSYELVLFLSYLSEKPDLKYPKYEILTMEWHKLDSLPSNTHVVVKKLIKKAKKS